MDKILCVGMTVCDVFLSPVPWDALQRDSMTIATPVTSCGGDALNVAMGLSKLGLSAMICGRIGRDPAGDFIRNACRTAKVDDRGLLLDLDCPTAASYALIDPEGERHFLSDRKMFHRISDADVQESLLAEADIVYVGSALSMEQMNAGGLERLFRRAKALGKKTAMDAALTDAPVPESWLESLRPVLQYTDVFFPSREEAEAITGKTDLDDMKQAFQGMGLKVLGIKLGSKGCFVTDFREDRRIPAVDGIHVVDTCGAGDSFMAGYLCGMTKGWSPWKSAAFGSAVAALNVQAVGGTAGIPPFDSAYAFYHKNFYKFEEMR